MESWLVGILASIISGALAGGIAWGGMRSEVKGMRHDLEKLYDGNQRAHVRIDDHNTRISHIEGAAKGGFR